MPNQRESSVHRLLIIIFAGIVAMVSSGGAQHTLHASNTGVIDGIVSDSGTGKGIASAYISVRVALLTYTARTDASGAFTIGGIPPGENYAVRAEKNGYRTASVEATVAPGDTTRVTCELASTFLELLSPNGGESIFAGSEVPVRWTAFGIGKVNLEFSINDGRDWMTLAREVDASGGVYIWDVPDIPSPRYRIRISDHGASGLSDTSDGPFGNSSI